MKRYRSNYDGSQRDLCELIESASCPLVVMDISMLLATIACQMLDDRLGSGDKLVPGKVILGVDLSQGPKGDGVPDPDLVNDLQEVGWNVTDLPIYIVFVAKYVKDAGRFFGHHYSPSHNEIVSEYNASWDSHSEFTELVGGVLTQLYSSLTHEFGHFARLHGTEFKSTYGGKVGAKHGHAYREDEEEIWARTAQCIGTCAMNYALHSQLRRELPDLQDLDALKEYVRPMYPLPMIEKHYLSSENHECLVTHVAQELQRIDFSRLIPVARAGLDVIRTLSAGSEPPPAKGRAKPKFVRKRR